MRVLGHFYFLNIIGIFDIYGVLGMITSMWNQVLEIVLFFYRERLDVWEEKFHYGKNVRDQNATAKHQYLNLPDFAHSKLLKKGPVPGRQRLKRLNFVDKDFLGESLVVLDT